MIVPPRSKIMLLLGLGTAVIGAGLAVVHAGEEDDRVSGKAFVAWVRENAVQFDTLDWRKVDLSRLSVLDQAIKGKRIVYLGEPRDFVVNGGHGRGILVRQADAFFFVAEVTACQLR